MKLKSIISKILLITAIGLSLASCGKKEKTTEDTHIHTYEEGYSMDNDSHWHNVTCGHADAIVKEAHNYNNGLIIEAATEEAPGTRIKTCKTCGYKITEPVTYVNRKIEIESFLDFEIDSENNTITGTVANDVNELDLTRMVFSTECLCGVKVGQTSDSISYIDKIPLVEGWNSEIVIVLTNEVNRKSYLVSIYRKHAYNITFDTDGGETINSIKVEEGTNYMPSQIPFKEGYIFDHWSYNSNDVSEGITITSDVTLVANYSSASVKYTVNHYLETLDGTFSATPDYVDNLTGGIDALTTATSKKLDGFTAQTIYQQKIKADGTTIVKVRYNRHYNYLYTYKNNAGMTITTYNKADTAYGQTINLTATVPTGYVFDGWYDENDICVSPKAAYSFEMPDKELKLTAKCSINTHVKYTVKHYFADLEGKYPSQPTETETLYGTYNQKTNATAKKEDGFLSPTVSQETISANGSTIVKIYYPRLKYELYTNTSGLKTNKDTYEKIYYDKEVTLTALEYEGYTFLGWYDGSVVKTTDLVCEFDMPNETVYLVATYQANTYTVTLNKNGGTMSESTTQTVTYDAYRFFPQPTRTNYVFIGWKYNGKLITDADGNTYGYWKIAKDVTLIAAFIKPSSYYSYTDDTKQSVYYGYYPQTLITDSDSVNNLNNLAGDLPTDSNLNNWKAYGYYRNGVQDSYMYYIDLDTDNDGINNFRGVYIDDYRPEYTANTSTTLDSVQDNNGYMDNSVYWFEYKPIQWDIIRTDIDRAFIVANLLLDSQSYSTFYNDSKGELTDYQGNSTTETINAANYQYSYIRSWLNTAFTETAFYKGAEDLMVVSTVTNASSSQVKYNDTKDRLFLLSYSEINNSTINKAVSGTDYAKCQGLINGNANAYWLTRSISSYWPQYVSNTGGMSDSNQASTDVTSYGVRPAAWIYI